MFFAAIIISMIKQLRLKDYILIDELTANFDGGLNIITGETGAGKSILINAIDLVFAPRVSKEVIKTGCDKAAIELVIENKKHDLTGFYTENGIDNLGDEIIITKEITSNGVRSRINGTLVNTELLRSLRALFVDIHSQHQTYSFMQPKYHITLLDSYGKDSYGGRLDEYKTLFAHYQELKSQLVAAKNSADMTESQIEFLKFQINEIETAEIKSETEDEDLTRELEVLENAEKLKELTGTSYWALNGDEGSILEGLNKIKANISKAASFDPKLSDIEKCIIDASEALKEAGSKPPALCQALTLHGEIHPVHPQQLLVELGFMERHGSKFFLKSFCHIHHRVGLLGKVKADGSTLPGGCLRFPGIPGQGGGDKGLGCRLAGDHMVPVGLVPGPGIRTEDHIRADGPHQLGNLSRQSRHAIQGAIRQIKKVEFLCSQSPAGSHGLLPARCRQLGGLHRPSLGAQITVGHSQIMDLTALGRQGGNSTSHADLVVIGVGLDTQGTLGRHDVRRSKKSGYVHSLYFSFPRPAAGVQFYTDGLDLR